MTDVDILSIVAHRQWLVLTGALLMALVVLGRTVAARAGLTGLADRVVSVASAYLSDLSWMLPAAGYDYWPWALVAALRGTLMSGGLAELIADLIRRRWPPVAVVGLLLVALAGTGCGVTQAQVAVQTSLTGLAEGVRAGDGAIVAIIPGRRDEAIADARTRCAVTQCPDALAIYAEAMAPPDRAVDGLEVAAEALRVAQVAQDAWVASDELPDAGPLCGALGDAVAPLVGLLDEAGAEVPPGIAGAGAVVEVICGVVARWATPATVEVSNGE